MTDEPCAREHLQAIRPLLTYWDVDDDGEAVECVYENDDPLDIEQYICNNCHRAWRPSWGYADLGEAWQAALDHLPGKELTA